MWIRNVRCRIWVHGSNTVISTALFIGILILVALIAQRHSWRADFSEAGVFTLSEQTRRILESLENPISIKGFYASDTPQRSEAEDRLDTYGYYSSKIEYELIDPDRHPETARRYDVQSYGTLVLEGYGKTRTIQSHDEETVTNAILKLMRKEKKKVYFLTGHGERSIKEFNKKGYSGARSALEKENYAVKELSLMRRAEVPEDAAVVVVAGPEKPLFKEEIASLDAYLQKGGKLAVLLDPSKDGGLERFVGGYGLEIGLDMVIDQLSRVFGGSYLMPVVAEYGAHKITENFGVATFYPEARSVFPVEEPPEEIQITTLASTSPNAWAETDMDLLKQGQAEFDEGQDKDGPVPLVVLVQMDAEAPDKESPEEEASEGTDAGGEPKELPKGHLLVCGDSDFIDNTHFGLAGNGDFFLNAVNYLAEEETLITIEPRRREGKPLILTRLQGQLFFWIPVVFVPLAVLLGGFAVYRIRSSQR